MRLAGKYIGAAGAPALDKHSKLIAGSPRNGGCFPVTLSEIHAGCGVLYGFVFGVRREPDNNDPFLRKRHDLAKTDNLTRRRLAVDISIYCEKLRKYGPLHLMLSRVQS